MNRFGNDTVLAVPPKANKDEDFLLRSALRADVSSQAQSMHTRLGWSRRAIPVGLGLVTLAGVVALFAWDISPRSFPAGAHNFLAAFPLAMIAVAYLVYQSVHRPAPLEFVKAIMLAAAFLFWAANQLWPELHQATLFNDVAIVLFVLDVFLVMIGWPPASPDEAFAETYVEPKDRRTPTD